MLTDPYATGVLNKDVHERLVANLDDYAKDAGVQPYWIWTPMSELCGKDEIDYVRKFHHHRHAGKTHGLCYVRATEDADVHAHMSALAGALVRNHVRARVMPLRKVLNALEDGAAPSATCLLIPNFFLGKGEGGTLASWAVQLVYDMLLQRAQSGQQTVLYASNVADMGKEYGTAFASLIKNHYVVSAI